MTVIPQSFQAWNDTLSNKFLLNNFFTGITQNLNPPVYMSLIRRYRRYAGYEFTVQYSFNHQ